MKIKQIIIIILKNIKVGRVTLSNIDTLKKIENNIDKLLILPDVLKIIGLILLSIALLRPQEIKKETFENIRGINIIIALDVSGSMQAEDLKPNRLEAAKDVCRDFVDGLKSDRVGLVVFAGKSFTQCPLTIDYAIVKNFINQLDLQTVRIDGTAIGDGIINSVNRLENARGSKVIILTTDGVNNRGVDPIEAAKIAAYKDIKIYTIGIGKKGGAPMTYIDPFGIKRQAYDRVTGKPLKWEEPDEKTLKKIAEITGGRYFRATDEHKLKEIYRLIGKLEKQDIKVKTYNRYIDKFYPFLVAGFLFLLSAFLMEVFKFTRVII